MVQLSEAEETRALELHKKSIVVDAHSDIPFDLVRRPRSEGSPMKQIHLPSLRAGGVDVEVFALTWDGRTYIGELKRALRTLDVVLSEVKANSNELVIATKTDDIYQAKKEGKIALVLGFEGGKILEGEVTFLRTFYELGIRYLGFTWNHRNQLADGVGEPTNGGLSEFGQAVVGEANKLGVLLDVSHLSEAGFWDVFDLTKVPLMASHSNANALCDHPRNLTDDQIKAIAENDGVIGINFVNKFLNPHAGNRQQATLEDVLDHIDHMVNLVGINHVGLGPDYMDYTVDLISQLSDVSAGTLADEWSQALIGLSMSTSNYPEDLESIVTLPKVTRGLVKRGYSDSDIEQILGGNFLRLFKTVIG